MQQRELGGEANNTNGDLKAFVERCRGKLERACYHHAAATYNIGREDSATRIGLVLLLRHLQTATVSGEKHPP